MNNMAMPGNPRYQPDALRPIFGYDNIFRFVAEVELATMDALGEIGVIPAEDIALLTLKNREALLSITTSEVDKVEREVTKHDIRAWVQIAQGHLPPQLRRWVHIPLTSYDPIDTARALQFKRAHMNIVRPYVREFLLALSSQVETHASTVQIGRTHGQHALPITVGFWLANIVSRVLTNAKQMDANADRLVGKISGAVGAYNAQVGLGIAQKCPEGDFEQLVLQKLGLRPGLISSQIVQPEPVAYYLISATMMSAALAQFGRDCRCLMRTEIGEIGEPFVAGQVGSSTMAHKRNPITFENAEGMWYKNVGELTKVFMTLISEHQRDLVGSCVARDFPAIIVNLVQQLSRFVDRKTEGDMCFIDRMTIDVEACERNFSLQADRVLAEPMYILLQMAGYTGDAHELVNHRAVPLIGNGAGKVTNIVEAVARLAVDDRDLLDAFNRIPAQSLDLLRNPKSYIGRAHGAALGVVQAVDEYVKSSE